MIPIKIKHFYQLKTLISYFLLILLLLKEFEAPLQHCLVSGSLANDSLWNTMVYLPTILHGTQWFLTNDSLRNTVVPY
jgi:hypothetical protein